MPQVIMSTGESSTECAISDGGKNTGISSSPCTDDLTTTNTLDTPERMIGEYKEELLVKRAKELVARRTKDWEITNIKDEERVPRLHRDEIEPGRKLGQGGFFCVSEINRIKLLDNCEDDEKGSPLDGENSTSYFDEDFSGVVQNRKFMEKHCIRKGKDHRYALKTMREECKNDPKLFVSTMVDLAIECRFLATVRHPNIIKLRAVSVDFISSGDDFLVLDRLYSTLTERISKWKDWDENGFAKLFDFGGKKQKKFLAERLTVAYDVASALAYLHDRSIIYRDLKPDNIGFDVRQDAKLFDFGLATEFNVEKCGRYQLTGDTGTIRYMAPEVACDQPYTEKADVYSFGVLLWQILSLEEPFPKMSAGMIEHKVCQLGIRPKIDPSWSNPLRRLLQDCFSSQPRRPLMDVVCTVLRREVNSLADKKLTDEVLLDSSRSAISARTASARYFNE